MNAPVSFVISRSVIGAVTLLLGLLLALGLGHHGPLSALGAGADQVHAWFTARTTALFG
jgi:hypothetical protein